MVLTTGRTQAHYAIQDGSAQTQQKIKRPPKPTRDRARGKAGLVACKEDVRCGAEDEGVSVREGVGGQGVGGCGGEVRPVQAAAHEVQPVVTHAYMYVTHT